MGATDLVGVGVEREIEGRDDELDDRPKLAAPASKLPIISILASTAEEITLSFIVKTKLQTNRE